MSTFFVNDLSGVQLDLWTARAEGLAAVLHDGACMAGGKPYAPTSDPALSAGLIARHQVEIFAAGDRWSAELAGRDTPWGNGATREEAALRAIVAARFGDMVEEGSEPARTVADVPSPALDCFWLVFLAAGDPPQLLGHAIMEAVDMDDAVDHARRLRLYPGADVRVYGVNAEDAHHIPATQRNRALTAGEAAGLGWQDN